MPETKSLSGKKILLGITGSIAAYKTVQVVRDLTSAGCDVEVVLTRAARHFVSKMPLQILSKHKVHTKLFDPDNSEVTHVSLAMQSDLILIAPTTADFIAKMALGLADDLLSTLVLSVPATKKISNDKEDASPITTTASSVSLKKNPLIVIAPAMDLGMWDHPAVKKNVATLIERGCVIIEPESGPLASGLSGVGRMADEKKIVSVVSEHLLKSRFYKNSPLSKEVVLVTAGPTREAIDPVRFISNRSSGKMGYELAIAAHALGAEVILISGPVALSPPSGVKTVQVESAKEMKDAVDQYAALATVVIMAAAVCDYTPMHPDSQKEKKKPQALQLTVTDDILKGLARNKTGQIRVGFAAETNNLFENALKKLTEKKLDLIVANDITVPGAGFDCDTNIVDLIHKNGEKQSLPKMHKRDIARKILEAVIKLR